MMKNSFKKIMVGTLATLTAVVPVLAGCGGGGGTKGSEKIDTSKTQLYVYNFYGGFGSDWLNSAKKKYEEMHKDDVYEEGKQGIQIYINNSKDAIMGISSHILDNRDEVYFTEYAYYHTLKSEGVLADITPAITADLSSFGDAAGKTIEGKLTEQQRAYYGIAEDDGTHYYAIPHYSGYSGLIYNIDLFDQKGYYFKANHESETTLEDHFIYYEDDEKSPGPDGVAGTADDGLPVNYTEFFMLCDFIAKDGNTPVAVNGANNKDYVNNMMQAAVANIEGLDQMMINYTLDGLATDLGTIKNGQFVKDAEPTQISGANKTEIFRQEGKYQGLKFVERLAKTDKYHNSLAFNSSYSHLDAQDDFLYAGYDGVTKPIAMLCEGIWWESEATSTFKEMADKKGSQFAKLNRHFGFMPMPLPDTAVKEGRKNTLLDHIYSMCFVKKNIVSWKLPIALDFIKFVNSDAMLVDFTQITNTPKALQYDMSEAQLAKMSTFGRSVIELKQTSDIVYPFSSNPLYINHQSDFGTHSMYFTIVNGSERQWPSTAFVDDKYTAEQYFSGLYAYYNANWHW